MKKILGIIVILFFMIFGMQNMNAQSVNVGYLNSSYIANDSGSSVSMHGNGVYIGVDYDYSLGNNLYLTPALNVDFADYNIYGNLHGNAFYLRAPVHIKYVYTLDNKVDLFGTAGPSLSYALSGKVKYHEGGISYSENLFDESDQRFDIPLGFEVGVNINKLFKVVAGYDFGLLNQIKDSDYKLRRNLFHVGIGYNF